MTRYWQNAFNAGTPGGSRTVPIYSTDDNGKRSCARIAPRRDDYISKDFASDPDWYEVQVVAHNSVVIDPAAIEDIPVDLDSRTGDLTVGDSTFDAKSWTPEELEQNARESLRAARYLREHPWADPAQVTTLSEVLFAAGVFATNGESSEATARYLVGRGVRVEGGVS